MRRLKPNLVGLALIAAGMLAGCGGSAPPPTPPENEPSPPGPPAAASTAPADRAPVGATTDERPKPDAPPPGSPLDRVMKAHFKDALLIREAVIRGTPEDASNPATVITEIQNLDALPAGWREFVERMQQTARRITNSTSTAQAAAAAADLGVSCGMCHQRLGGPKAVDEPAPAAGTTIESRMKRHAWATERLWEGLYVPSSAAWDTGAKGLDTTPFPKEVLKDGGVHARSAAGDFARVAARASTKKTTEERAALYAELLTTCGGCHQAMQGKK